MRKGRVIEMSITIEKDKKEKLLSLMDDKEKEISTGIDKYLKVIMPANPEDPEFQKNYAVFYRLSRRKQAWKDNYFKLLCAQKTNPKEVGDILAELYEPNKYIEISFASKMIATFNPNMPIIDKWVLINLDLNATWSATKRNWYKTNVSEEKRIEDAVDLYNSLDIWYKDYIKSSDGEELISRFNQKLSKSFEESDFKKISNTKKIDFLLWQYRK